MPPFTILPDFRMEWNVLCSPSKAYLIILTTFFFFDFDLVLR